MDPAALEPALACFASGDFFDAHEELEPLWLAAAGVDREALHGLLQVAVGLHHAQQGNAHGTGALLDRALGHLANAPDRWAGLDLARLRADVAAFRDRVAGPGLAAALRGGVPPLHPADC